MNLTLEEAQAQLATINAAITEYRTGTRRTKLTVGSKGYERRYEFSDPKDFYKTLCQERDNLQTYIDSLLGKVSNTPVFTAYATIPVVVK